MATAKRKATAKKTRPRAAVAKARPAAKKGGATRSDASPLTKAEAKEALARETKAIVALGKDLAKNAWQIGRRLMQVSTLDLHRAAGYASVEEFAATACAISKTTAFMYMRVAGSFSQEIATSFGMDKLDRGLAYIASTPEDEKPGDLPKLKIRVPDESGHVQEKAFEHATVRELKLAASHERGKAPPHVDTLVAPHVRSAAQANRALDAAVGKSNAGRAEVTLYARDGLVLFDVRGVPLADAGAALAAVKRALG
jgi:hypothetical protein